MLNSEHRNPPNNVHQRIDAVREHVLEQHGSALIITKSYEAIFLAAARFAWQNIQSPDGRGRLDLDGFATILLEKHKRYGAEPLRRWGALGIVIRIDSKLARYDNLRANPALQSGTREGVWDTLIDLLGYAVLGAALIDYALTKEHR